MLFQMNADSPRHDLDKPVGLYIETKMYNFYLQVHEVDMAEKLYQTLRKYGLETVEQASARLPIIVECFEKESLWKFAELSDLPLVYLMFSPITTSVTYDLEDISGFAHAVGPHQNWLFQNETFNATAPSRFVEECHRLELAVHPYSLQDDMLKWTTAPLDEHELFANKQVDGIFTEFPHLTKAAFLRFKSLNEFPPASAIHEAGFMGV